MNMDAGTLNVSFQGDKIPIQNDNTQNIQTGVLPGNDGYPRNVTIELVDKTKNQAEKVLGYVPNEKKLQDLVSLAIVAKELMDTGIPNPHMEQELVSKGVRFLYIPPCINQHFASQGVLVVRGIKPSDESEEKREYDIANETNKLEGEGTSKIVLSCLAVSFDDSGPNLFKVAVASPNPKYVKSFNSDYRYISSMVYYCEKRKNENSSHLYDEPDSENTIDHLIWRMLAIDPAKRISLAEATEEFSKLESLD